MFLWWKWCFVVGIDLGIDLVVVRRQDVHKLVLLVFALPSCVCPLYNFRRVHVVVWGRSLRRCRRLWHNDRVALAILLVSVAGAASQGTWGVHQAAAKPAVGSADGLRFLGRWYRLRC